MENMKENTEMLNELQQKIDVEKWEASEKAGMDLCGEASYCKYCDKSLSTPCARASIAEEASKKEAAPKKAAPKKAAPKKSAPKAKATEAKSEVKAEVKAEVKPAAKTAAKKPAAKTSKAK